MRKIVFINCHGGGYADYLDVPEGATVGSLFSEKVPHSRPEDRLIRVNRQPAPADQRLVDGDRVSFTPTKIEGVR